MPEPVADYLLAARAVAGASSAVVCAHVNPDGDAIGSVLALTLVLRELGIDAVPTLADARPAPAVYDFLPGFHHYRQAASLEARPLFIALDTPGLARLGEAERLAVEAGTLVVIDHHPDNQRFGHVNIVDPSTASTGQMLWRLLPMLDVAPDPEVARCLYVTLLTDTGRFQYSNTTAGVLRDAAAMVDLGVDITGTYAHVYESASFGQLALMGRAMARLTVANGGHVAYAWIGDADLAATGAGIDETENLVDVVRTIGGVDAVFLVKERDGECHVSLRAKGPTDVGSVARLFGGGGHRAAAGFTHEGALETLLPELLAELPGAGQR